MRLFALQESRILGEAVATRLGVILDAHEERRFDDGEHKTRPLVSVRGADVYVIQSLGGTRRRRPMTSFASCCSSLRPAGKTAPRKSPRCNDMGPSNSSHSFVIELE
ncbi:ribose-phosphate pyrophosphokinase-like domain-containing protein [Rhizobium leguminosarum]|uniref:ribose-phosphate pyrophosphokinase-like domain-containing protein n=1 Tax=Rhizobium leguminosarum TaxID=384 RepID=UPI001FED8251|nr:ribose-phosphate pyrophosphokinase-like domain-containing protein [Rhizobium leguminosarum]